MSQYPGSMNYDLGLNLQDDPSQPSGPADQAGAPSVGGSGMAVPSLTVNHGIAFIFFAALAIYSGAAYVVFRRINQAV